MALTSIAVILSLQKLPAVYAVSSSDSALLRREAEPHFTPAHGGVEKSQSHEFAGLDQDNSSLLTGIRRGASAATLGGANSSVAPSAATSTAGGDDNDNSDDDEDRDQDQEDDTCPSECSSPPKPCRTADKVSECPDGATCGCDSNQCKGAGACLLEDMLGPPSDPTPGESYTCEKDPSRFDDTNEVCTGDLGIWCGGPECTGSGP